MCLLHILVVLLTDSLIHSFCERSRRQLKMGTGEITPVRIPIHVITFRCQMYLVTIDFNFFLLFRHLWLIVSEVFNFINVDILKGRTWKISCFRLCFPIWNGRYHIVDNCFADMLLIHFFGQLYGGMTRSSCITEALKSSRKAFPLCVL